MATERTPLLRHESAIESNEAHRQTIAKSAILVSLSLERLAFYAVASTFYLFLNEGPWEKRQAWSSLEALNAVFIFSGISYVSALLGGYLSDAWLGRFRTIIVGFILYLLGYLCLTLMSVDALPRSICSPYNQTHASSSSTVPQAPCKAIVYISASILGTGVGVVSSNIVPFAAEQMRTGSSVRLRSFFNWLYWCINLSSFLAISVISYIEQDSPGHCSNGFFCGYLIATACLSIALVVFVCCNPWYYKVPHSGSLLTDICTIVWEATKAQYQYWKYRRRQIPLTAAHIEPHFLDRAKIRYGGSYHEEAVDDVRSLGKLLAVFVALIPYWLVYFQMSTSFQAQGLHMRFAFADDPNSTDPSQSHFSVPAAWLGLFDQLFLIAAIPLLSSCLYPKLDRAGFKLSLFFRMGLGMLLSFAAVVTAGGLESYRTYLWRTDNSSHIDQVLQNVTYHAVDISIFWQMPQYVLVGAAEAFASIAGLEYAYSASPSSFQAVVMGVFYSLEGIASFLGITLLQVVSPYWFNNVADYGNINSNHLDFYLYFLATIQFLTFIIFATVIYIQRFSLQIVALPPMQQGEGGGLLQQGAGDMPSGSGVESGNRSRIRHMSGDRVVMESEREMTQERGEDEENILLL